MNHILEKNCNGKGFKSNVKSFERAKWKLFEYAGEGKHPIMDNLGDVLRCRASFEYKGDLKKAYEMIAQSFKIIRLKNKIETPLKNLTMNIIFEGLIVEIQLIFGNIGFRELENHQVYEIVRCLNIGQLYDVLKGWGGYDHLNKTDIIKAKIIDNRPMKTAEIETEKLLYLT
jgi:hypothetical protein